MIESRREDTLGSGTGEERAFTGPGNVHGKAPDSPAQKRLRALTCVFLPHIYPTPMHDQGMWSGSRRQAKISDNRLSLERNNYPLQGRIKKFGRPKIAVHGPPVGFLFLPGYRGRGTSQREKLVGAKVRLLCPRDFSIRCRGFTLQPEPFRNAAPLLGPLISFEAREPFHNL